MNGFNPRATITNEKVEQLREAEYWKTLAELNWIPPIGEGRRSQLSWMDEEKEVTEHDGRWGVERE